MESPAAPAPPGGIAERLRDFLRSLPIDTCARLLETIENAKRAGDNFPGAELIAGELSAIVASGVVRAPRRNVPQRFFFSLFEPFLVDESLPDKTAARIERASLRPVWNWMSRDLLPKDFAAYEREVGQALAGNDAEKARNLTVKLQKSLPPLVRAVLAAKGDEAQRRKVIGQLGGERVAEDLK